jgi:hypothetical protein
MRKLESSVSREDLYRQLMSREVTERMIPDIVLPLRVAAVGAYPGGRSRHIPCSFADTFPVKPDSPIRFRIPWGSSKLLLFMKLQP